MTTIKRVALYMTLTFSLVALWSPAYAGTNATSGITVSDLLTRIKQELNDDSGNFFSDTEAMRWASEAVGIIASQARCLEISENATVLDGVVSYALSTSHYDVETVLYDNGDSGDVQRYVFLDKIDPKDLYDKAKAAGRPLYWWEWSNSIYLWPIPGSDQNGTTIQTFLIGKPSSFSATTDVIPTPYYFDPAILLYMKAKMHFKDEKYATAQDEYQLFKNELGLYRGEVRKNISNPKAK